MLRIDGLHSDYGKKAPNGLKSDPAAFRSLVVEELKNNGQVKPQEFKSIEEESKFMQENYLKIEHIDIN